MLSCIICIVWIGTRLPIVPWLTDPLILGCLPIQRPALPNWLTLWAGDGRRQLTRLYKQDNPQRSKYGEHNTGRAGQGKYCTLMASPLFLLQWNTYVTFAFAPTVSLHQLLLSSFFSYFFLPLLPGTLCFCAVFAYLNLFSWASIHIRFGALKNTGL